MRVLCVLAAGAFLAFAMPSVQADIGPELDGMASFGAGLGIMRWVADEDAAKWEDHAAQIRPISKAVFRYRFSTRWVASIETGFGWNSYAESNDLVTWVIPTTIGLERRIGSLAGGSAYAAFGGGFYVWGQRQGGNYVKDPVSFKDLHATEPGVYAGVAAEKYLAGHVTVAVHTCAHYIHSIHGDDFPGRMGGDDVFLDLRIGLNYYFSPYEGLIWGGSEEE